MSIKKCTNVSGKALHLCKKAHKSKIYVGRSLPLQIFCFILLGYAELRDHNASVGQLYEHITIFCFCFSRFCAGSTPK